MRVNIGFFNYEVSVAINKYGDMLGVNSLLKDSNHMLLLDYDNVDYNEMIDDLHYLIGTYFLPDVYVLSTGVDGFYHCYSFCRRPFKVIVEIVNSSTLVDRIFMAFGIARGYFTLRISDKRNREFTRKCKIDGIIDDECSILDVLSLERYRTKKL